MIANPSKPAQLAPMEGVSEWPFRIWMAMFGGFTEATTPFVRVTDTYPQIKIVAELTADRHLKQYKVIPQLMASDPDRFTQVAEELLADFDFVELNCGCPSPKVYKHGAGSQLLCDPDYFQKFIETATQRLGPQKLAVKIRLGIQQQSEAFRLLEIASLFKLKKLTIHGRTKVQGYKGSANWGVIDFAADKLPFKVVGSGDIVDCQSYKVRTLHSQVDSVIIGRGAMKNPWIFSEILGRFQTHVSNNHLQEILTVYYLLQIAKVRGLSPQVFSELNFNISGEVEEFWSANCRKILALLQIASKDNIPYCRPSFGRLKMIWTHIRYRTCENPENMAAALRTSDPNIFFTKMKELRKDSSKSSPSQSFHLGVTRTHAT